MLVKPTTLAIIFVEKVIYLLLLEYKCIYLLHLKMISLGNIILIYYMINNNNILVYCINTTLWYVFKIIVK